MSRPVLRDYQIAAVNHIHQHPRSGLFLDMGLGKTAATLASLRPEDLPVLVVAPKRVAESVWPEERDLWRPDLSLALAAGSPQKRAEALEQDVDITVIGRDNIKDAVPHAQRYQTLVLDELSGFKTHNAARSRAALKISKVVPRVIGLTGTPAANGLLDLWHQLKIIDGGERLGTSVTQFRNRYFMPGRQLANGVITEWLLRPGADKRIHDLIDDICMSMSTEGRVELPPVTFNHVKVPLPPEARKVYKEFKEHLVADLDVLGGEIHTAANAAVLSSKLSQVTAGFMYVDDADIRDGKYDIIHKEKIKALEEIVDGTGNPILVFYRFRAERDFLLKAFPQAVGIDDRGAIQRWNRREVPILVAHPQSAGHGLNLQHGGSTIVWTSLTWSLEEWEQANKRLHRSGQKDPVIIHTLISPGTVDGAILERLNTKKSVQQALMNHLESPL